MRSHTILQGKIMFRKPKRFDKNSYLEMLNIASRDNIGNGNHCLDLFSNEFDDFRNEPEIVMAALMATSDTEQFIKDKNIDLSILSSDNTG